MWLSEKLLTWAPPFYFLFDTFERDVFQALLESPEKLQFTPDYAYSSLLFRGCLLCTARFIWCRKMCDIKFVKFKVLIVSLVLILYQTNIRHLEIWKFSFKFNHTQWRTQYFHVTMLYAMTSVYCQFFITSVNGLNDGLPNMEKVYLNY